MSVDSPPADSDEGNGTATSSTIKSNHIARLKMFTRWLFNKLFDPEWEHRHGAASCLREIVKKLVQSLGKLSSSAVTTVDSSTSGSSIKNDGENNASPMSSSHKIWFESCLCKLFQVIALDRFADYIGDETVAPVRETCTQTIGIISRLYTQSSQDIERLCAVINMFLGKDINQWEINHSGKLDFLFKKKIPPSSQIDFFIKQNF